MARRLHGQRKLKESLRWYAMGGTAGMTPEELTEYADLLHDSGKSEEAVALLTRLLDKGAHAQAYERRAHIYNELGKEAAAIADMDAAIRLDPEPYIYWYTRAISYHDLGNYEQAVQDFKEALKRRENSKSSTYYELGNVYMKMGKFDDARESYERALDDRVKAIPHYYYRLAQALEKLHREREAGAVLREGIALQDEWFALADEGAELLKSRSNYSPTAIASFIKGAHEEYGFRMFESRLLEADGRPEEALVSIERALARYPDSSDLQLRQGVLLRKLNRHEEAIGVLRRLKERNPVWLAGYMELCTAYRLEGHFEQAVAVLQEAKLHFPDNPVVRYWLVDAYREADKLQLALEENRLLTELEPGDSLNWKQRAELNIDSDNYDEAEQAYTKALELDKTADYYMRRSFVRYMKDRHEEAMLDVQEAIALDESLLKESKTAYALGELYVGMENWALAEAEFSRAMALEPDNVQVYDRRARCRFAAEQLEGALEDCNRGLQLDPGNVRLTWLRGLIHYRLEDHDAALRDSISYSRLLPDDPQGHYNLGLVYNQLDRYDDAIDSFTKVLEINPFEAQAYLERASLWYHHSFDRVRAVDDLAQWLLYAGGERGERERFAMLGDLRGFDDDMRERAKEQYLQVYGSSRYLS